jgi:hypothetical protein
MKKPIMLITLILIIAGSVFAYHQYTKPELVQPQPKPAPTYYVKPISSGYETQCFPRRAPQVVTEARQKELQNLAHKMAYWNNRPQGQELADLTAQYNALLAKYDTCKLVKVDN